MLQPITFAFLIIGGMIPFAFAAMTMKSVGVAAMEMVYEVQRQFDEKPHLLDANPTERPDYDACIAISTKASLKEMVPPGALVIFTPLLTGIFFGVYAVSGLLVGSLVASVQLAVSMSNSGGAWDNAKKYIEKASPDSDLKGKGSDVHKAAVVVSHCDAFPGIRRCTSLTLQIHFLSVSGRYSWRSIQGYVRPCPQHCDEADGSFVPG